MDVRQALLRELLSHPLYVETELPGAVALARSEFLLFSCAGLFEHLRRLCARHDHDTVVVGDDDVAGLDPLAGAHDADVHVAERLLDGAERRHALRPDGELHTPELGDVAAAGVDDEAAHPTRL